MLKEALELHNHLNPALWDKNQNLLPEVEDRLNKIVAKFQSECLLPLDIVDVHLVGSNASYNYTKNSDLDVHIVVNFDLVDCDKEILVAAYNLQKAQFNKDYDISIRGIDVEMYIEDINSNTMSNGIYSLFERKWIKKPQPIQVPNVDVSKQVKQLSEKIKTILNSDDSIEVLKTINMLYMMRKNSLVTEGEFGVGNLTFKEIRSLGLLDELKSKLKELQSKQLTLENLNEDILEEDKRDWYCLKDPTIGTKLAYVNSLDNAIKVFNRYVPGTIANNSNVTQISDSSVRKFISSTGKTIDDFAVGSYRRSGMKDTHELLSDYRSMFPALDAMCVSYGLHDKNVLIHHLDGNDNNFNIQNLCIIPYQPNKNSAEGIHKILHSINYSPRNKTNANFIFITALNPNVPIDHTITIQP